MSALSLVFIIYIVFGILRAKKKQKERNISNIPNHTQNYDTQSGTKQVYQEKTVTKNAYGKKSSTAQNTPVKGKEKSTVDYLAEKAEQDQREHEIQERREELNKPVYVGEMKVATRLYEGDLPPNGTRVIKCHYCGADNLVPKNAVGKYACYFCREQL